MITTRRGAAVQAWVATLAALASAGLAGADVVGIGSASNWTLNGRDQDPSGSGAIVNANDPATISGGTLTITTAMAGESRSAFFNTKQNVASFVASFTYQQTNQSPLGASDGFTFCVQNQGTTALGGDGSALGYGTHGADQPSGAPIGAIALSAAQEFYLRASPDNTGDGGVATSFNDNAQFANAVSNAPVNMNSGDPVRVSIVYDDVAETIAVTLTDLTTSDTGTFSRSADITGVIEGSTAYIGFTGGTGGAYSVQQISNFTFTSGVPEPATLGLAAGVALLLGRRRRR